MKKTKAGALLQWFLLPVLRQLVAMNPYNPFFAKIFAGKGQQLLEDIYIFFKQLREIHQRQGVNHAYKNGIKKKIRRK